MTDDFVDPGEPGELSGRMKAKDLINKPLIIRPREIRHDGEGKDDQGNPKAYTYVDCDVWVLDRQGILEHDSGVRFSWARVVPQLEDRLGQFVAGTPVVQDDNSRVLQPFTAAGKEIARTVIAEIRAQTEAPIDEEPPVDDGTEPF